MTDSVLRPVGAKKRPMKVILTTAAAIIVLGAGYLWLTRTQVDARPGRGVRLQKASLFGWNKTVYAGRFRSMESGERLFQYNNPFIESEANLDFFAEYDKNLGGIQRVVLDLGGVRYHIHKRHPPLPRMRRRPRPPAGSVRPLSPPAAAEKNAAPSSTGPALIKDYAIRDEGRKEYLPGGDRAEALIKQALEIAEKKLAEARAVFRQDVIKAREKAAAGRPPASPPNRPNP
jgi:hypothetical protein